MAGIGENERPHRGLHPRSAADNTQPTGSALSIPTYTVLLDSDTRRRPALDIADVANRGADRVFAIGRNSLFHFPRCQPGILPNDCHDWNVDVWKNILGGRQDSAAFRGGAS